MYYIKKSGRVLTFFESEFEAQTYARRVGGRVI